MWSPRHSHCRPTRIAHRRVAAHPVALQRTGCGGTATGSSSGHPTHRHSAPNAGSPGSTARRRWCRSPTSSSHSDAHRRRHRVGSLLARPRRCRGSPQTAAAEHARGLPTLGPPAQTAPPRWRLYRPVRCRCRSSRAVPAWLPGRRGRPRRRSFGVVALAAHDCNQRTHD